MKERSAVYEKQHFDNETIAIGAQDEYVKCRFSHCDLSNQDFRSARFEECQFDVCDLSNTKLNGTSLQDVTFRGCKVIGVDFGRCSKSLFSVQFENCILDFSLFIKNNLKGTTFKECRMGGTNFLESNLQSALFLRCDLDKAVFEKSNLEKADFTSSFNYLINPSSNKLKKTKFSLPDVVGLLGNLDIIIE